MGKQKTFDEWFAAADRIISMRVGVSLLDLPDCCYADWFEEGISPARAVARAIRYAKGEGCCF